MSKKTKPRPKILLVFKYSFVSTQRKRGNEFCLGEKTARGYKPLTNEKRLYERPNKGPFKEPIIGGVYEVEIDKDGTSIFFSTAKYVGRIGSSKLMLQWQAEHEAVKEHFAIKAAEKKARGQDPLVEALADIREAYHSLPGMHRQTYLARVVRAIVAPRKR